MCNSFINFVSSSTNGLSLNDHITGNISTSVVTASGRASGSDGINIIIGDLCHLHICILTIQKYFGKGIYL